MSSSLILHKNSEPFLNWIVTCDEKWILYDNWWRPAQWLDWEEASKHLPKPNVHQSDPLQVSKSWWNHYIWKVCSASWWDAPKTAMPAADIGNREGPIILHNNVWPHIAQNQCFKSWTKWATKFCLICHSPDLLPTNCHFVKHLDNFLQGKYFHNQQEEIVCWILKHGFLHYRNKQTYFLL